MTSGTIIEAICIIVIVGSLTGTVCIGVISGDTYEKVLLTFMGYVLGRVFNHTEGKE